MTDKPYVEIVGGIGMSRRFAVHGKACFSSACALAMSFASKTSASSAEIPTSSRLRPTPIVNFPTESR
jgi:hypothetical protein